MRMTLAALLALLAFGGLAPTCGEAPGARAWPGEDWPMALYDATGSAHNTAEHRIGPDNVGDLEVKWVFDESDVGHRVGPVHGTPVVDENRIFFGTNFGRFYAVDADGNLMWEYVTRQPNPFFALLLSPSPVGDPSAFVVATPVTGAAVLPRDHPLVIFADLDGNVYALHRETGQEVWVRLQLNPHPIGGVVGNSLLLTDDTVVIGFASIENSAPSFAFLGYECCSHTGFVAALDIATGKTRWRYETTSDDEVVPLPTLSGPWMRGSSGADVWGQPTWDRQTDTVYFGTGQNFSPKPDFSSTETSDAIIALDAETGEERWLTQLSSDDIWVDGVPSPNANGQLLDTDVGDSPKIYELPGGRRVVGAGQKNGAYHVLDAATGEILYDTTHVGMPNQLGGFQQGGAVAGGSVFQHGLNGTRTTPIFTGVVMALSPDGVTEKWRFEQLLTPTVGSLAVANGVVYFQSPVDESPPLSGALPEWALYGLDAETGAMLLRMPFPGRAISSPVVSRGRVYIGMGNTAVSAFGTDPNGGIVALGLP